MEGNHGADYLIIPAVGSDPENLTNEELDQSAGFRSSL